MRRAARAHRSGRGSCELDCFRRAGSRGTGVKGAPGLSPGDRLLFDDDGGTATVRGVTVDAVIPWERPFESGKRYLIFGTIYEGGRFEKTGAYEEPSRGAPLLSLTKKGKGHHLEELAMVQAVDYVENELRK